MDAIDRLLLRADVQAGIAALQRVDHGEKGFFVLAVRALVSFVSSRPFLSIEDRRAIGQFLKDRNLEISITNLEAACQSVQAHKDKEFILEQVGGVNRRQIKK